MKVFITKYALTEGIMEVEVEHDAKYPDTVAVKRDGRDSRYFHGEGIGWHHTREGAVVRAEAMRAAALSALARKERKLKQLEF